MIKGGWNYSARMIKYVILTGLLLVSLFSAESSHASDPGLTVEVYSRATGRPMAGVEVTIEDAWGFFDYVHRVRDITEANGKAFFGPKDFDGFTIREGLSWYPGPFQEKFGRSNYFKINVKAGGETRYFEIREENLTH